jgi:glucose-6-phosphate 1-epimerase
MPSIIEQLFQAAGVRLVGSTELYPALHKPGDAGLPMLVVENELGHAVLSLQGAHLMAFQPRGGREMLWVSPKCILAPGMPIRGGIPLCLPWFGSGPEGAPQHGFGRVMEWTRAGVEACANGATRVVLELAGDASLSPAWPHAFRFRLEAVVGSSLQLILTAENQSATAAPFAFAFHTYLAVPNVAQARVEGLDGLAYLDKVENFARKVQQGELAITGLTDRIYLDVPPVQTVVTGAGDVRIESDTKCVVVWNAWTNDKTMADIGEGNHAGYLCVERGDVADRAVTLAPGDRYRATMTLAQVN